MSYQAFINSGGEGHDGSTLTGYTLENNTALGINSGVQITSGLNNTCIGNFSGVQLTSGSDNTCIGYAAGSGINNGNNNCALGSNSLQTCSQGLNNIGIGANSCQNITDGDNNVGIGKSSLSSINAGNNNVAVGYQSGNNLYQSSSNNTCIGYDANPTSTLYNYEYLTLIGSNCSEMKQDENNQFVLGSIETIYIPSGEIVLGDDTEDSSYRLELSGANSSLEIQTYSTQGGDVHNTVTILDDNINMNVSTISIGSVVESGANYQLSILGENSTLNITTQGVIEANSSPIVTNNMIDSGSSTSSVSGSATVTFATAFSILPSVCLIANSPSNNPYINSISTTQFTYTTTSPVQGVYWLAVST